MSHGSIFIVLLLLGVGLGAVLAVALYATELGRMSTFLRGRDRASNGRATTSSAAPGLHDLACALNDELDLAAQEHVDALRRRQEFQRDLSALSHDIRTPLMGAKGYLQLAREEADAERRDEHLEAASKRIDSTVELLDQLFAYTKSTDPDFSPAFVPVELRPLVEEALLAQYPAFECLGWSPDVAFEDSDARVVGDRETLSRILANLVVNALRHGAGSPRVTQVRDGQGNVVLSIENRVENPHDIDASRLFDRFYQADAARGTAGSGLGLAVCANLARAMGMGIAARIKGYMLSIELTMRPA